MSDDRGLLYPALHKFYSALRNLEEFKKGSDLFDNISRLDGFFTEYRNVTFVLQKSISETGYESIYESIRDKYLVNDVGRWLLEQRNITTKQKPFDLEKSIVLTRYTGGSIYAFPDIIYTIDNDEPFDSVTDSLRADLIKLGMVEVFFSAEFVFRERGHPEDLYESFIRGISNMSEFLAEMSKAINQNCTLCDELNRKIQGINFYRVPKDLLFTDDYAFNCKENKFQVAARIALTHGREPIRVPLASMKEYDFAGDVFGKFEMMHLMMHEMQGKLLPTIFVIYDDDTFELDSFGFSIRTTVYRKFNAIAKRIKKDGIVEVMFVCETYQYDYDTVKDLASDERIEHAVGEALSFYAINNELELRSRSYDPKRLHDWDYRASIMFKPSQTLVLPLFLNPVKLEFSRLLDHKA